MKPPTCSRCKAAYSVIFRENEACGRRGPRGDFGKHPLLLRCGHTFCRPCLRKCETSEDHVKCPTCQKVTRRGPKGVSPDIYIVGLMWARRLELEHQSDKILLGDKTKSRKSSTSSVDGAKAVPVVCPLCADCRQPADCRCDRCECFMCTPCFDSVHGKTVSLRKHKALPLQPQKEAPSEDSDGAMGVTEDTGSRYCASHSLCQIEYFCNQDQMPICSRCVIMGDHKGHDVQTMEDKNQESVSEMEPAMLEVRETLWRLNKAEEVVKGAMPYGKGDSNKVVDEVKQHFQELHSLLQAREEQLVDDIREAAVNSAQPFREMVDFLQSEKTRLNKILTEAAQAMQRSVHTLMDADLMVERLRRAREVPCVATVDTNALAHPVMFSSDTTLRDAIGSYGRISTPNSAQMFSLTVAGSDSPRPPPEELPPVKLAPVRPPASLANLSDDIESVADSASVIVEEECESVAGDALELPRAEETETVVQSGSLQLVVGQEEKIRVTHIRTPCQFYVQLGTSRGEVETLQRHINTHCRNMAQQGIQETLPPLHAGTLVLAQFSQDKNWYRAVVISVHQPDAAASQDVDVLFMDYGNTERVSLSKLRPIKPKFESFSAFAHECCLHDLLPVNKMQGWTKESVELMLEMTSSGTIVMKVLGKRMGSLMVDLVKPETLSECVDDQPVSLRETLIVLHLAAPTLYNPIRPPVCRTKHEYISLGRQQEGDVLPVVISHVETPSLFFVQICEPTNVVYIEQQSRAMQDTYQGHNGQRYTLFCPREGQMCMALFDRDERWYRARLIGIAGGGKFRVQFVDYGNCETVDRYSIRKMVHDYIRFPEQAIECCLADVEPTDNRRWSEEAVQWFKMTAEGQYAQLRVVEHCTQTNKVRCVLYLVSQDQLVCCVNVTIGQKGLARTTGTWSQKNNFEGISILAPSATSSETSINTVVQGSLSSSSDSSVSSCSRTKPPCSQRRSARSQGAPSTKTQAASPVPKRTSPLQQNVSPQAPRPSPQLPSTPPGLQNAKPKSPRLRPSPRKVGAVRTGGNNAQSQAKKAITLRNLHKGEPFPGDGEEENGGGAAEAEAMLKSVGVEVVVTGYRSPAHFFIQLQEKQKELNELMTELAAYEAAPLAADRAWAVGECCVARHTLDHRWYRAQITAIRQDTSNYQVLLMDYGIEDVVEAGDLRLLQKAHAGKECFSQRCHLANLVPAGSMDPTRWSSTAVDFMADQIRAKRLFVKLEGDRTEALGLPVDILVEVLIPETALEPLRHHYLSLVASLQDSGLAFPRTRPSQKSTSDSSEELTEGQAERPARTDPFLNSLTAAVENSPATSPVPARQAEREDGCREEEEETVLEQPDLSIDPHPPPTSPTISVIPVHVDSQAVIYAHDKQAEKECTSLMDAVDLYAQRQAPRGRLKVKVGQVCVAYFPDDNGWYRARVLEVLHGNVKVKYVDYGNTKRVDVSQLRMIPPELCRQHQMAYEFKLHNLIPNTVNDTWASAITEFMDKELVNSRCTAVIKGDCSEVPVGVNMVLAEGTSLNDTLLRMGVVKKEDDMKDFYQRTEDISNILQHSNPFFPLRPGEAGSVFRGIITHMELPNLVYIQRCAGPDNQLPEDLAKFAQLMDDLNDPAISQHAPLQELPAAGEVCCACYSQDQRWYRGLVAKTFSHDSTALVFYVDYGNSEIVSLDRLHTLPAQFQDMPAQALRAYLNIDLPPGVARWTLAVYRAMGEAIYLQKHIVFIKVLDKLTVDLFSEDECGATTLSYQPLIDSGAISVPQMFLVAENEMAESDGVDVIVESCIEEIVATDGVDVIVESCTEEEIVATSDDEREPQKQEIVATLDEERKPQKQEIVATADEQREPQDQQPEPREKEAQPAAKESELAGKETEQEQDKEPDQPESEGSERDGGELQPELERNADKLLQPEQEINADKKLLQPEQERTADELGKELPPEQAQRSPEKPSERGEENEASEDVKKKEEVKKRDTSDESSDSEVD